MRVTTHELREAAMRLLDHLERNGQVEFEVSEDFYWCVPSESCYDQYVQPNELTVGQLSDDWREVQAVTKGAREPLGYGLVWLASVLRRIGELATG